MNTETKIPDSSKTCCICGAILTERRCLSCGHGECAKCPLYVPLPTIEELQTTIAALTADRDALQAQIAHAREIETQMFDGEVQAGETIAAAYKKLKQEYESLKWANRVNEDEFQNMCDCVKVRPSECCAPKICHLAPFHEIRLLREENAALKEQVATLQQDKDDLQKTFDMQWDADQRGIKMWQDAHPGKSHIWPDRAKMIFWLLEQIDRLSAPVSDSESGFFERIKSFGSSRHKVKNEVNRLIAARTSQGPHDPACPCNDGDVCHYVATADTPAMTPPSQGTGEGRSRE